MVAEHKKIRTLSRAICVAPDLPKSNLFANSVTNFLFKIPLFPLFPEPH